MSVATATALGVEGATSAGVVFFGGLSAAATLGIGLALAAGVAGAFYLAWTREVLVKELTEEMYKHVMGGLGLKERLLEAGGKNFEEVYEKLRDVAEGLFEPTERSVYGCGEYGELVGVREKVEELLGGLE